MARVPFTILTGWLGAGKTTALNRMLAAPHGRRIAVLVNELGRISIDTQLIVGRGGDVLELAGGCVCCKVDIKNDLWDGIARHRRRARRPITSCSRPPASPSPPRSSTGSSQACREARARAHRARRRASASSMPRAARSALDDARRSARASGGRRPRADRQARRRDCRRGARDARACSTSSRRDAERASFPHDDAGALAMTAWVVEPRKLRAWTHAQAHAARSRRARTAITTAASSSRSTFADDAPLVGERVMAVIEQLGARLVRAKGFVHLAGERAPRLRRARRRSHVARATASVGQTRRGAAEIVLIGDDLDEAALRRALWACRAASPR